MMGGFFSPQPPSVKDRCEIVHKMDFENNSVIWSDRQETRATCWENLKDLPACDVGECKRSDGWFTVCFYSAASDPHAPGLLFCHTTHTKAESFWSLCAQLLVQVTWSRHSLYAAYIPRVYSWRDAEILLPTHGQERMKKKKKSHYSCFIISWYNEKKHTPIKQPVFNKTPLRLPLHILNSLKLQLINANYIAHK